MPHGMAIQTAQAGAGNIPNNPYKYQGIELNKNFGLEMYEARYRDLDPQLGRFWQIDPKAEKYYSVSPNASMNNNPALNVDPLGDDWFVNNKTGGVLFVKNESKVSQELFDKHGFGEKPGDYDRFGPDKIFGNKAIVNRYGADALEGDFVNIENPEEFMGQQGYKKAEKVLIKETEHVSGGTFGGEENISHTVTDLRQIGDAKTTYAQPKNMNTKKIRDKSSVEGPWSSSKSILYDLTKPYGQSNRKTAEYYGNQGRDYGSAISGGGNLWDILKAVVPKKK